MSPFSLNFQQWHRKPKRGVVSLFFRASRRGMGLAACRVLPVWRRPFSPAPVDLEKIQTVLVTKFYGIGNMILLTPFFQTLRQQLPWARIVILSDGRSLGVIESSRYYDEAVILPTTPGELERNEHYLQVVRALRKKRPDLILSSFPMAQPKVADLYDLLGAKWSVGYDLDGPPEKFSQQLRYDPNRHEVLCNLDLLAAIGLKHPITALRLVLREEHREEARAFLDSNSGGPPWFAFHCGSFPTMLAKRWPVENFAALGDRISQGWGGRVIIVGGEDESDLAREISGRMQNPPLVATGRLSILGTAALLQNCRLMVSNDSGLMHLAAAVGTPVVGLFGPTSTAKNAPWTSASRALVLQSGKCPPCYKLGQPLSCPDPQCMKSLSVEQVWQAISAFTPAAGREPRGNDACRSGPI